MLSQLFWGNGLRCVSFMGGVGILRRVAMCYVQLWGGASFRLYFPTGFHLGGNSGVSVGAFM